MKAMAPIWYVQQEQPKSISFVSTVLEHEKNAVTKSDGLPTLISMGMFPICLDDTN